MSDYPKTVKDFNPDERPQEKAETLGIGSLSLPELWALILRSGQPGVPITNLTRSMMYQSDGKLRVLERRSRKDLMQIPGIGRVKALQIEAVLEIMRRYNMEKVGEKVQFRSSKDIFNFMLNYARHLSNEKIWIIHLNKANRVIDVVEVSSGGSSATVFDIKKILKDSLLTVGCEGIVMCHNHPSGNLRPSGSDDKITQSLSDGCRYLDIRLLDHIIIGGDEYYSYSDNGRL